MKSNLTTINTQTRGFVPIESSEIVVNGKEFIPVGVVDEPLFPHSVSLAYLSQVFVPFYRLNSRNRWNKSRITYYGMVPVLKVFPNSGAWRESPSPDAFVHEDRFCFWCLQHVETAIV